MHSSFTDTHTVNQNKKVMTMEGTQNMEATEANE